MCGKVIWNICSRGLVVAVYDSDDDAARAMRALCLGNVFVANALLLIGSSNNPEFLRVSGEVRDLLNCLTEGTSEMLGTILGSGIL
jgi:hypothetical protein